MSERPDHTRLLRQVSRFLNSLASGETDRPQPIVPRRLLFLGARLSFAVLVLMTSFYCVLAYIPFTYNWVIRCTLVSWLPVFVKLHPLFYWATFGLVAATMAPDVRRQKTRRLALGFIGFHLAAGMALLWRPLLAALANDGQSLLWGLVWLFPLVWVAAIDYAGHHEECRWEAQTASEGLTFAPVALSAIFVSGLYTGIFYLRFVKDGAVAFRWLEVFVASGWSLFSHLLIFTALFAAFRTVRAVSGRFASPLKAEFFLCNLLAAVLLMLVLQEVILAKLSFGNQLINIFPASVSAAVMIFLSGIGIRLYNGGRAEVGSGFTLMLLPLLRLTPGKGSPRLAQAAWLFAIVGIAYAIPASVAKMDWDFLIQKLSALFIWLAAFTFFYSSVSPARRRRFPAVVLLAVAIFSWGAYRALSSSESRPAGFFNPATPEVHALVEQYAAYDVSFKVARDALSADVGALYASVKRSIHPAPSAEAGPVEGDAPESAADSFYDYLRRHTDLPPSVRVNPVAVNLADHWTPKDGAKPHVFIFVIDSLRQDYLAPYNPSVTFTPSLADFARDSVVMRNAFTRYGGTVLSEPSLWVGGAMLHKQYIEPFYPMNALQKLVEAEGYQSLVTVDPVLRIILKPSPAVVELDKDLLWFQYDFCRSLKELEAEVGERRSSGRPVFAYVQPQNLHAVTLTNLKPVPPGERYPGFYEHYAAQVKYLDACFGEFIRGLKERGIYDDSIIIVTSDHGDALGEQGRWGHSHWVFPEIIRVPLLIHLPEKLRNKLFSNPEAIAFLTDITPTLYYLLGHRPIVRNGVFGRPLFTESKKEHDEYLQREHLIASSYGPVYGILSDNGRSLFIADAVNQSAYFYNLADDPKGARNLVTDEIRARHQAAIREHIEAINRFYGLGGGKP